MCTTAVLQPRSQTPQIVQITGPLRAPLSGDLEPKVRTILARGGRTIVLDLARVSAIDAVGVGELVRLYNLTTDRNGVLQIAHATMWVREVLQRVGLFDILSTSSSDDTREPLANRTLH
jgi:anti-anti-sigma factor